MICFKSGTRSRIFKLVICISLILGCTNKKNQTKPKEITPPIVLWAWYKHQDLRFINPKTTGVAFAARTISVGKTNISIKHRTHPLLIPNNTHLTAVIRIELKPNTNATAFRQQRSNIVDKILTVAKLPDISALQIDFDAPKTFRPAYLLLLQQIAQKIPTKMILSITALASWCLYDRWLNNAPIDKAVPMMFAMGNQTQNTLAALEKEKQFLAPLCQGQIGISTNEQLPFIPTDSQIYIFSPGTWREAEYIQTLKILGQNVVKKVNR